MSEESKRSANLVRVILEAQETERERFCLEVHDGLTQTLVSAFWYLQTLESIMADDTTARPLLLKASGLLGQAIQECREMINGLQPATLRELGLIAALRQELRQLEAEEKWRVDFKSDIRSLPKEVETELYRIAREAITNIKKHAEANSISVHLLAWEGHITLEVKDNGRGFDLQAPDLLTPRKGAGLISMRKRAELLGGSCLIDSQTGIGTTVRVELPTADGEQKCQTG